MKIDEKTSIPLIWFFGTFGAVFLCGWRASAWMTSVDDRLTRIEQKIHLTAEVRGSYEAEANAGPPEKDAKPLANSGQ